MMRYRFSSENHKEEFIASGYDDIDFLFIGINSNELVIDMLNRLGYDSFVLEINDKMHYNIIDESTSLVVESEQNFDYHFTQDEVDKYLSVV